MDAGRHPLLLVAVLLGLVFAVLPVVSAQAQSGGEDPVVFVVGGTAALQEPVADALRDAVGDRVRRIAGPDRFATSAAVSEAFPVGVSTVYVATGAQPADALAAAPAAARDGAPVLLTSPDGLPASTAAALQRLEAGRIVVLGGPSAVSDMVVGQLQAFTTGAVQRIAGADRYATAAAVSATFVGPVAEVFLASGEGFADALSGGAAAAAVGAPLLVTRVNDLPQATADALAVLQPATVTVLGGPGAVAEEVVAQVVQLTGAGIRRLAGPDRIATAVAVSQATYPDGAGALYLASGATFPDALSIAPVAGGALRPVTRGVAADGSMPAGPILLSPPDQLPDEVLAEALRLLGDPVLPPAEDNAPPTVSDVTAATTTGTPVEITLEGSDTDGDALTYAVAAQPVYGTVTVEGDTATYSPAAGFTGTDTFSYTASDAEATSDPAMATITVQAPAGGGGGGGAPPPPPPPPPAAVGDTYAVVGNTLLVAGDASALTLPPGPATTAVAGVLGNDTGDGVTVASHTEPAGGHLDLDPATGAFSYLPDPGFTGTDTFTYEITDGSETDGPATVTLVVEQTVWYIDADAAAGGDGRSSAPFDHMSDVYGPAGPGAAGDTLFLATAQARYLEEAELLADQRLLGEPAGLTVPHTLVGPIEVVAAGGGDRPVLAPTTGNAVELNDGVEVREISVRDTGAAGGAGIGGSPHSVAATVDGVDIVMPAGRRGVRLGVDSLATFSDIQVTTQGAIGFDMVDGDLVTVTGTSNTLSTTGDAALRLQNTDIGAAGVTFRRIDVDSPINGIVLINTGTDGAFSVTGDGSDSPGGNGSGGTITAAQRGVQANRSHDLSLRNLHVTGFSSAGVQGIDVTGEVTLDSMTLDRGTAGIGDGIGLDVGTLNEGFAGARIDQVELSGASISATGRGLIATTRGSTAADIRITDSTFTGWLGDAVQVNHTGTQRTGVAITGSTFASPAPIGANGVDLNLSGPGVLDMAIGGPGGLGNTFDGVGQDSINSGVIDVVAAGGTTSATTRLIGSILGNTITGVTRRGIMVAMDAGGGTGHGGHDVVIADNSIQDTQHEGIQVNYRSSGGLSNAGNELVLRGNQVGNLVLTGQASTPGNGFEGILIDVDHNGTTGGGVVQAVILVQDNQGRIDSTSNTFRVENDATAGTVAASSDLELTLIGNSFTNDIAVEPKTVTLVNLDDGSRMCLDANSANTDPNVMNEAMHLFQQTPGSQYEIEVDPNDDVVNLPGTYTTAQIETFLTERNTPGAEVLNNRDFLGVTACELPS